MIAVAELMTEWEQARARAAVPAVRDWLLRSGLSLADLVAARLIGGVGVAHIVPDGVHWQPSVDPRDPKSKRTSHAAVIVPVWESVYCPSVAMLTGDEGDAPPALIDLVAFLPRSPAMFWRRTGFADFLGAGPLDLAGCAVHLQPHPLAWLGQAFLGMVPLTHAAWAELAARPDLTLHVGTIDDGLAVKDRLEQSRAPLPQIVLPAADQSEAA
jgi:hypothetical protein